MKVAIHQPQYFPWLPYLLKIEQSDVFILLDTVDFQKNGLQNRNQIKTGQGAHWLTVPVRHQLGQKIQDVKINRDSGWRRKHWQTLLQNYRRAPAFAIYAQEFGQFYAQDWEGLNELNMTLLFMLMRWMDICTPIMRSSEMKATGVGSELVLNLCLEVGATQYISGSGGRNYLESRAFERSNVEIIYQTPVLPNNYPQLHTQVGFINDLSVVDMILNCGESWREYLPVESVIG